MRFDTPIYFQRNQVAAYNPTTGNYEEQPPLEEMRYAAVTYSTRDTMNLIYGEIKQGSLTLRLQNHYTKPFDRIRIGNKAYRVDSSRLLRVKNILVVSEVQ